MPAHRVPTTINEARGTYKKNPSRARSRVNEPIVADPIGPPPACFLADASGWQSDERKALVALWTELIGIAAPGVLNQSHRWHLELACREMYKVRRGTAKPGEKTNLGKLLTQMGMNPAAQSTVSGGAFTPAGGGSRASQLREKAQALRAG